MRKPALPKSHSNNSAAAAVSRVDLVQSGDSMVSVGGAVQLNNCGALACSASRNSRAAFGDLRFAPRKACIRQTAQRTVNP